MRQIKQLQLPGKMIEHFNGSIILFQSASLTHSHQLHQQLRKQSLPRQACEEFYIIMKHRREELAVLGVAG